MGKLNNNEVNIKKYKESITYTNDYRSPYFKFIDSENNIVVHTIDWGNNIISDCDNCLLLIIEDSDKYTISFKKNTIVSIPNNETDYRETFHIYYKDKYKADYWYNEFIFYIKARKAYLEGKSEKSIEDISKGIKVV